MHSLSSVVFCLSIHNNPYICFSKNLLTFNALTLYYFYMKKISAILWMVAIIIRKSKCSRISKRKVHFTKRNV